MNIFKNLKNSKLLKPQIFSFSSKLFAKANIKSQKTFKFTKNQNEIEQYKIKEKLESHITRIKQLKEHIKKADYETYNSVQKDLGNVKVLKRSEDDSKLNPINYEARRRKANLSAELRDLSIEVEKFRDFLGHKEKISISPKLREKKEQIVHYGLVKNVFSYEFRFANRFLSQEYFDQINIRDDSKPYEIRKQEQELEETQKALEGEVSDYVNEKLNKEMEKEKIETLRIPKIIASKPFVRTPASKEIQPSILLVENDLNLVYDLDIEYERLLKVTSKKDDFGFKVKEEDDKQEVEERGEDDNEPEESIKECLNSGNYGNLSKIDSMITKLV